MVMLWHFFSRYDQDEIQIDEGKDVDFRVYIRTFIRETSWQGLPQIMDQPGYLKKFFWIFAVLLCTVGLGWECWIFFVKFATWPKVSLVTIGASREHYFPAVTLCNNNPVTRDWFESQKLDQEITTARKKRQAPNTPPPGGSTPNPGNTPNPNQNQNPNANQNQNQNRQPPPMPNYDSSIQNSITILEKAATVDVNDRLAAGHQLCDMVMSCRYNGEECSPGTSFSKWHWSSTYGNCFTFNAGYSKAESPTASNNAFEIKKGDSDSSGVLKATSLGENYGLYLILNADVERYVSTTETIGWRMVIHNQTEMPFPDESSIFVGPGTSTRIGMDLKYSQQLGIESNYLYDAYYSDCESNDDLNVDDTRNAYAKDFELAYSESACRKTCYQKKVMSTCSVS